VADDNRFALKRGDRVLVEQLVRRSVHVYATAARHSRLCRVVLENADAADRDVPAQQIALRGFLLLRAYSFRGKKFSISISHISFL